MEDNSTDISSRLFTFKPDSYFDRTRRPVYAITYLLGFLVFYELGLILIRSQIITLSAKNVRVVSFAWIQNILVQYLNFTPAATWFITPLVVILILLALQITSKTKWKVYFKDFVPMTIECILLALPLIVLSLAINRTSAPQPENTSLANSMQAIICSSGDACDWLASGINSIENQSANLFARIITGIGAGIYEEFIFRLILICIFMMILQDLLNVKPISAIVISVMASAVLFSLHHHIFYMDGVIQIGESFSLVRFLFRTLAGIYFAAIFASRGFAIAAGTHIFYDIIAALTNVLIFPPSA
ncbi:MAG: CPBP family intramembrane metalloprotease [Planctomycetes bacterium]|nr:CPBP family intramembrane metalloprotease [Planctomycetota bacterium]